MPIQVRGVLVHAMSGTELSRVRTEFRLRLPEPINKSPLESRGPTLLCNQIKRYFKCPVRALIGIYAFTLVLTFDLCRLLFSPRLWPLTWARFQRIVPAIPWVPAVIQNLIFRAVEVAPFHWSFVTMREVPIVGLVDNSGFRNPSLRRG